MNRMHRVGAEFTAARKSFFRRRTAVFFTFFFPLILVVIFGALVRTRPGVGGIFSRPPAYYVAGYLAVVVLFTPLSRVGAEVARNREGNRFEKLATTPLSRLEWLAAQTLVNVVIIGLAGLVLLALVVVLTGAQIVVTPATIGALVAFVAVGVALFCGVGAILGSIADSQDGVIAASNTIALPLLFLSETFVPPSLLPSWLPTWLSPLTFFSRGVRTVTTGGQVTDSFGPFVVLTVVAIVAFVTGALALPRTD